MPPFVSDLTVGYETRTPIEMSLFSPIFRNVNVGLSFCTSSDLNFISEDALLAGFTQHTSIQHTVLTPLGHPRVNGILGQVALEYLGL